MINHLVRMVVGGMAMLALVGTTMLMAGILFNSIVTDIYEGILDAITIVFCILGLVGIVLAVVSVFS